MDFKYKCIIYEVYNISLIGLQSVDIETYSHVVHIYIIYIINTSTDAPVIYTYIIYVCEWFTYTLCIILCIYRYLHINEQRFDVRLQTEYS